MRKLIVLFLVLITIFGSSCTKDETLIIRKIIVMVHGAWQGPYAWQFVKAGLEKNGYKVVAVELPGHGSDLTPPQDLSMNVYLDKVISAINQQTGKVILVGHSMGGAVITAVAEMIPKQIEKLVYIGAFVPANGQSLLDLANSDPQSLLGPALIPSDDKLTLDVKQADRVNIFCQDGSDSVKALLESNFRVEPAIPFTNELTLTDANFGKVDKYYIHTLMDHAIGMDLQNSMVAAANIAKVYSVNSGHTPLLSVPDMVTNTLLEIVK